MKKTKASDIDVYCRHDKLVDITELIENPRNPNTHPEKQIALLAKIIRAQGWRSPIVVSERSGFIVKGHGRLQAAKTLQVEKVPVEYQQYENEAAEYADLIADNRISELSVADEDAIQDLLQDVTIFDSEFDFDITGFDMESLGKFDIEEVELPELDDTQVHEFIGVTFNLHEQQNEVVQQAIKKAKSEGGGKSDVNENSNGNSIFYICERFLDG